MRGIDRVKAKSGVYMIRLVTDKRAYVGSAKNIRKRLQNHTSALRLGKHHSRHLQRAWDKHGEGCFECFAIGYYDPEQLMEKEQQWMDDVTCAFNGSRIAYRIELTPEVRAKISEKVRAHHASKEYREAAAARMRKPGVLENLLAASKAACQTVEHRDKLKTVHRARCAKHEAFGETWSLKDLAEAYGVKYTMLCDRVNSGWDVEKAVLAPKRKGGL